MKSRSLRTGDAGTTLYVDTWAGVDDVELHDCSTQCDARRAAAEERVARPSVAAADKVTDHARVAVLSHQHFTASDLGVLLAGRPTSSNLSRMRDQGTVVAVRVAFLGFAFPAFQFDPVTRRVDPNVGRANAIVRTVAGVEESILWWLGPSTRTGSSPAALLVSGHVRELLDQAARHVDARH